jgi:hypothetical protein
MDEGPKGVPQPQQPSRVEPLDYSAPLAPQLAARQAETERLLAQAFPGMSPDPFDLSKASLSSVTVHGPAGPVLGGGEQEPPAVDEARIEATYERAARGFGRVVGATARWLRHPIESWRRFSSP